MAVQVNCPQRKYDFVVFDWKGTLEPKSGSKAMREECALREASAILPLDNRVRFTETYHDVKACWKQKENEENITCTKEQLLQNILDNLQIDDNTLRREITDTFLRVYNTIPTKDNNTTDNKNTRKMFLEAEELLQKLIDEGIGISLVRNTTMPPKQFQETLNETGAHTYFHVNKNVILSGEIGFGKPDRRIFEAVVEKCQVLDVHTGTPQRILMVGNETEVDIIGGKNMGWETALIKTTESTSFGLADHEVSSLSELIPIIFQTQDTSDNTG
mmetsp:Transcript_10705/g.14670  ORF Transcript_10705/g.14670 Transcript_10705/m.14670 type:complete len:273 (+) Transcript_10705:178-996(+)